MGQRHVDLIRAAVSRLNASDVDGYLANFQPRCLHWISGVTDPMTMPAFVESLLAMRRGLPDMQLQEMQIFGVDNFVCAQWRTRGTHSDDLFGMPPTGRAISFDTAEVYEIDGTGRIQVSWAFGDVGELFRQIGESPAGSEA
jgi:predicted ester cyclase